MTVQAQEAIEYRNEKYLLIGAPLVQFLLQNPQIKFESYSTANWNGYQGYWLLTDDKLYIKNIKSSNYLFEDIFKAKGPILADWFTGTLEFGIGNFIPNHWWGTYEDYIWLNIDKGIVIEKKVIKRFYDEPRIDFGKYKGKRFEEILQTKIYRNTFSTIKNFLDDLLSFMINPAYNFKIISPYFKIENDDIELIKEVRNFGLKYFLTPNYIAISTMAFWAHSTNEIRAERFSTLLEKVLTSSFMQTIILIKNDATVNEISENSVLINPDINYLKWALKTVETFCVPPSFLEQTFKIKYLKNLKIKRVNSSIFEYEPVIETLDYNFPEHILAINLNRFEEKFNVIYNPSFNYYTHNIDEQELHKRFGHYLDESYFHKENLDLNENISIDDNNETYETYEDYNGSYAQDYENLSDQFINDVFDGDPDAYWNID